MSHPKTRAERRRNHIARDLHTDKYRQRVVPGAKPKRQNWRKYLEDEEDGVAQGSPFVGIDRVSTSDDDDS